MFKKIKEFFVGKPAPVVDAVAPGGAPYKVDAPWTPPVSAATKPAEAPYKVETTVAEVSPPPAIEIVPLGTEATMAAPTAKKAPAVRKPRAPKSDAVGKAVKEKAPVKAKAPKAPVAKKPAARTARSKKI